MSIVDKSHLQDVALGIWNKIQMKLNAYVHKTKENVVVGKTVLFDGYISGNVLATLNNPKATGYIKTDSAFFVCEQLLVSANQNVGQITIGIVDSKQIGDIVTGVNIGVIRRSDKKVLEYLMRNGVGVAHKNTISDLGCDRAITINVDKSWSDDVYLMVGANGALWGDRDNNYGGDALGGLTLPAVGSTIQLNRNGNYVGKAIIHGDGIALRDLANSSVNGVTKDEFNQFKGENQQAHQTMTNSINSANSNITSQGQRIGSLESGTAKLNARNRFTAQNTFMERNPIVEKYASIKDIFTADGVDSFLAGGLYCCNPQAGITDYNAHISAIVVPIKDSQPGDTVEASYFTVNATTRQLTSDILEAKTHTVLDVQYKGEYCIALNVNRTFNYPVSFGIRVMDKVLVGRRIGMLKQDLPNQVNNNAWSYYIKPTNGQYIGNYNAKFTVPYMIARRISSELITKYDINIMNNPTGEIKFLAYDAGEVTEINGRTWLRCDGQSVSTSEYNELCKAIQPTSEVSVDFKLPTNNSPVGYTYICAK